MSTHGHGHTAHVHGHETLAAAAATFLVRLPYNSETDCCVPGHSFVVRRLLRAAQHATQVVLRSGAQAPRRGLRSAFDYGE